MIISSETTNPNQILKRVTSVLLVCLLAIVIPIDSFACHKTASGEPKPHGPNGRCDGGGSDSDDKAPQVIGVYQHEGLDPPTSARLWAPTTDSINDTCVLQKDPGKHLGGAFPRHDDCATLYTDATKIEDDIILIVHVSNRGEVLGVEVKGQDVVGFDGIVHISDWMVPDTVDNNRDEPMVIHVHAYNVPLYKCDTHVLKPKSICDIPVGFFALHDLVYSP